MNDPVLTLRWFLNCPEIDNLEFFGDEDCLGNPITGVNVIDNPEGVPWIKKNELFPSTTVTLILCVSYSVNWN